MRRPAGMARRLMSTCRTLVFLAQLTGSARAACSPGWHGSPPATPICYKAAGSTNSMGTCLARCQAVGGTPVCISSKRVDAFLRAALVAPEARIWTGRLSYQSATGWGTCTSGATCIYANRVAPSSFRSCALHYLHSKGWEASLCISRPDVGRIDCVCEDSNTSATVVADLPDAEWEAAQLLFAASIANVAGPSWAVFLVVLYFATRFCNCVHGFRAEGRPAGRRVTPHAVSGHAASGEQSQSSRASRIVQQLVSGGSAQGTRRPYMDLATPTEAELKRAGAKAEEVRTSISLLSCDTQIEILNKDGLALRRSSASLFGLALRAVRQPSSTHFFADVASSATEVGGALHRSPSRLRERPTTAGAAMLRAVSKRAVSMGLGARTATYKVSAEKEAAKKATRELVSVLMANPRAHASWNEALSREGLQWITPPLRAHPGRLHRRYQRYVDRETGAADSSLFSPSGIWYSPRAPIMFALLAVLLLGPCSKYLLEALAGVPGSRTKAAYSVIFPVLLAFTSAALRHGYRRQAKWIVLMTGLVASAYWAHVESEFVFRWWLSSVDGRSSIWYLPAFVTTAFHMLVWPTVTYGLVHTPRRSFYLLYVLNASVHLLLFLGFSLSAGVLGGGSSSTRSRWMFFAYIQLVVGVIMALQSLLFWIRRRADLRQADEISNRDIEKYRERFAQVKKREPDQLASVTERWKKVQGDAGPAAKEQRAPPDIEALFLEADATNALFQDLIQEVVEGLTLVEELPAGLPDACDGDADSRSGPRATHHKAPVKGEERALQKVYRSYSDDWRKLCDLVRTTIVCHTLEQVAECLTQLNKHPDIELLKTDDSKNRLRDDFDAEKASGGYRDIQLSARLCGKQAKELGVEHHIVEIQIHLEAIFKVKSEDGHKNCARHTCPPVPC